MGFIDENYEINIIGQRTFVIRNFYNEIYPCEIENKIEALSGIERVCVVGLPDPIEIELPAALIVREKNSTINIDESVVMEVTNDLPSYKQLRGGIFFIDALPLTPSGKVQRKEAKEIATRLKIERESRMNT
jgi:acyl-CoA synthetase (AMP-forming)/AMP-acid ligase II